MGKNYTILIALPSLVWMISLTLGFFRRYFWHMGVSCGVDQPVKEGDGTAHCKKFRQFCPHWPTDLLKEKNINKLWRIWSL
jgi:hypothetical protein